MRQLEKCLGAAVAIAGGETTAVEHLPDEVRGEAAAPGAGEAEERDAVQRDRLVAMLREHRGNVSAVARALGKARMQVQRWMKRYGLSGEAFRDG